MRVAGMARMVAAACVLALGATGVVAQEPSAANATPIAVGDSVQGELTAASPFFDEAGGIRYAAYRLRAAGRTVRVTLRSVIFDSFLEVRKIVEGGTEPVGEDDDGGGNLDSQFSWDADGEYLLIVRHFGEGEVGPFTLVVEEPPPPPIVVRGLAPGLSVTERFRTHDRTRADGRRVHEYELSLAAGQQVTLSLASPDADVSVIVLRDGAELAATGAGAANPLTLTAPATARYTVHVVGAPTGVGAYTLSVSRVP